MAVCYNEIVTALGEPDREYPDKSVQLAASRDARIVRVLRMRLSI